MTQASRVDPEVLREICEGERAQSGGRDAPEFIGNVQDAVVKFKKVEEYTTFWAEYAFVDGAIVLHFFPPPEQYVKQPGVQQRKVDASFLVKWQRTFPQVLSPVAMAFFNAGPPQLVAQYTPELFSWYMRAGGFANQLDPDAFTLRFLERLDAGLDAIAFVDRSS